MKDARRFGASVHSVLSTRRFRRNAGLTLMEILIALFIFMIGIMGVMSMFPVAMNTASQTMGEARGVILARSMLAQITADCQAQFDTDTDAISTVDNNADGTGYVGAAGTAWTTSFPSNMLRGAFVTVTSGRAKWHSRMILSYTDTQFTVTPAWNPVPEGGDTFVVTRLGLPAPLRGVAGADSTPDTTFIPDTSVSWLDNQWNGYTLGFLSGNSTGITPGQQSLILRTTASPAELTLQSAMAGAITAADNVQFAVLNKQPRNAYFRVIDDANNLVRAGQQRTSDPTQIDALTWLTSSNNGLEWLPTPLSSSSRYLTATVTGQSDNTVDLSSPSPDASWVGRLIRVSAGDDTSEGQVRLIVGVSGSTATVYPNWTAQPPNGATCEIRSQIGYFLVVTSGRAEGRLFYISNHTYNAAGDTFDCGEFDWLDRGVRAAQRGSDYLTRNANTFMILGARSFLSTVTIRPRRIGTSSDFNADYEYVFNSFGFPKTAEPQTGEDFLLKRQATTANFDAKENSEYSAVCIFSDENTMGPDAPVRADIFVYRNFDSAKSLNENLKPVSYITGYIPRPR